MSQRVITIGRLRSPALGDLASDAADAFAGFADDTTDDPSDTTYDDTSSDDGSDATYDDGSAYEDTASSPYEDTTTDAGAAGSGLLSSVTSSLPAALTTGSVTYSQIAMYAAGALLLAAGATYLLATKGGSKWLDL